MKTKITRKDFEEYVSGWLFTTADFKRDELDMENIHAALSNALSQLYCDQDGIEAVTARRAICKPKVALVEDEDTELQEYFANLVKESEVSDLQRLTRAIAALEETIREKSFYKTYTHSGPR